MNAFTQFASIPRLFRECIVTEKIDGTNAQVNVLHDGTVLAGSRTRYITPDADNFGFATWVKAHEEELREGLGVGQHFGEWYGQGIQRKYGLSEKRFALFNVSRWISEHNAEHLKYGEKSVAPPTCCHVVPVIGVGPFDTTQIVKVALELQANGSAAAPGFMKPEGIVVFHVPGNLSFKYTFDKNDGHKGATS